MQEQQGTKYNTRKEKHIIVRINVEIAILKLQRYKNILENT